MYVPIFSKISADLLGQAAVICFPHTQAAFEWKSILICSLALSVQVFALQQPPWVCLDHILLTICISHNFVLYPRHVECYIVETLDSRLVLQKKFFLTTWLAQAEHWFWGGSSNLISNIFYSYLSCFEFAQYIDIQESFGDLRRIYTQNLGPSFCSH